MKNPLAVYYGSISSIILIIGLAFAVELFLTGFYVPGIDYLHCTSAATCLHEQAHRMDRGVSRTAEYQKELRIFAVENQAWLNWQRHNSPGECYAQMWESAGGNIENIPEKFRKFYSEKTND